MTFPLERWAARSPAVRWPLVLLLILVLIGLAGGITACGGGSADDDDAATTRAPAARRRSSKRMPSSNAVNAPRSISASSSACLVSQYSRSRRPSGSAMPKYASAALAPASRGLPDTYAWYTALVKRSGV